MDLYRRVASFLDGLKRKGYDKVLVFAHGGVLICAQIYAGKVGVSQAFEALSPYGGMIDIEIK